MGSSDSPVTGYKHYLGMHLAFCHGPIDKMTEVKFDDRSAWKGELSGQGALGLNAPELFGGESREGGVSGQIDMADGAPNQQKNSYLTSVLGADIPSFRGVFCLIFRQFYMGMNPYLKPVAIRAQRIHKRTRSGDAQWYDEKAEVGTNSGKMNPMHIIRECLNDSEWGMGHPEADFDDANFRAAADTLHNEGFGLCALWSRQTEIQDFIQEILRHVDGALSINRQTGKFQLKLIRNDYTIANLPVLGPANIKQITDFVRPTVAELTNGVTIQYWDMKTGKDASTSIQDIALARQQGAAIATTIKYPACPDGELAGKLAARDLKALSTALIGCRIECDRRVAHQLYPGDPFVLNWPKFGISNVVMRVMEIGRGNSTSQSITIDCAQDIFGLSSAIYAPPPPSGWENPVKAPQAAINQLAIPAPYWFVVKALGEQQAPQTAETSTYLLTYAARPTSDSINASLWVASQDQADKFVEIGKLDFTPAGTTETALTKSPESKVVKLIGKDLDLIEVGDMLLIGQEWAVVEAVDHPNRQYTLGRGVLHSVPAEHAAGTGWWHGSDFYSFDKTERFVNSTVYTRVRTRTGMGTLPLENAPSVAGTLDNTLHKPYPPANVKFNSDFYPARVVLPLTIAWSDRNRIQQTVSPLKWDAASITREAGVMYEMKLMHNSGSTFQLYRDVIDNQWQSGSITDALPNPFKFELSAYRGNLVAKDKVEHVTTIVGYGNRYGEAYGGLKLPGQVIAPQPATVDLAYTMGSAVEWIGYVAASNLILVRGWVRRKGETGWTYCVMGVTPGETEVKFFSQGAFVSGVYEMTMFNDKVIGVYNNWWRVTPAATAHLSTPAQWAEHNIGGQGHWSRGIVIGSEFVQVDGGTVGDKPELRFSTSATSITRRVYVGYSANPSQIVACGSTYVICGGYQDSNQYPAMFSTNGNDWTPADVKTILPPPGLATAKYVNLHSPVLFNNEIYFIAQVNDGPKKGYHIVKTANQGQSWTLVPIPEQPFKHIYTFGGYLFVSYEGGVYRSNNGSSWNLMWSLNKRIVTDTFEHAGRLYATIFDSSQNIAWQPYYSTDGHTFVALQFKIED